MKTHRVAIVLFFMALAPGLPARPTQRSWFVECSAGFALLSPADLNARLEAQQARADFLYRDNYDAQQRLSGGAFTYALEEPAGSGLQGLGNGFPLSLRFGRALGRRAAVFIGLQFLDRSRSSFLQRTYRVSDLRPDQVTPPGAFVVETGFPEYLLAARAWIPQLGLRLDLLRRRPWTAGMRLAIGPMFASLRTLESQYYKRTDADGYWSEWRQVVDMKGRGAAVALEAAARLELEVVPRLSLFAEGGYSLRRGSRFSGPGSFAYQYRDVHAAQNPQRLLWEDAEWRVRRVEIQRDWGSLTYVLSGNDLASYADTGRFRLDLSGWGLAAGLSWLL
jgi:hypothetical protein